MKNPPEPVAEGFKHCFRCEVTRPLSEFYRRTRKGRPSQTYENWCKPCRRAYYASPEWKKWFIDHQRGMRQAKRATMLARKVGSGCVDCGENHPACLEYHHRDPEKKVTEVVKLIDSNASIKRIEAEAEKCEVLCSNCHRKRHYNEREASKVASA